MHPSLPTSSPSPINTGPMLTPARRRGNPIVLILVISLVFSVLFLVLLIIFVNKWSTLRADYTIAKQQSYEKGKSDQADATSKQIKEQIETPFKSYIAPTLYGNFEVKYPKNWNAAANEEPGGSSLNLMLHPTTVQLNGGLSPYSTQIMLLGTSYTQYTTQLDNIVKQKKLKSQTVTVSGITGKQYDGAFTDKRTGTIIVLPVRDKTMTIANYDGGTKDEFKAIVSQIKINP